MKRIRVLTVIPLLFALALSLVAGALAAFDQEALDGIVLIYSGAPDESGTMSYWRGTGFFVGETDENPMYIITNCHVVEEFILAGKALGGGELYVVFDKDDEAEAYLVDYDYEKDIAVLKLAEPTDKRAALKMKEPDDGMLGAPVYAVGYPLASDLSVKAVTSFSKNDATVTTGSVSRLLTESGTGRKLIQTDASLSGGNSGGPLTDETGSVIGVNTAASHLDQNLFYAVSVSEALPLLGRNNIPYGMYEPEQESETQAGPGLLDGTNLYIIIGAAAAVVVIIAIIIIASAGRRRKRRAAVTPAAPVMAGAPIKQAERQVSGGVKTTPVVRSMSAQHAGLTVQLYNQPVQIGRDNLTCRIVFQEGTPGVSSRHCQVSYSEREGAFAVTDLGSTYGTFLTGGQRLAPNTPKKLAPKSSFYLGETQNTICVDLE